MKNSHYLLFLISLAIQACSFNKEVKEAEEKNGGLQKITSDSNTSNTIRLLSGSLTFHVSFDTGGDADFALGDRRIYSGKTGESEQKPSSLQPGLGNPALAIVPGQGKFGACLEFTKDNSHIVYYKAEKNVPYSDTNFNGTISFWLKLDPQKIPQTYTDPLQLTDKDYSNSAIWVDFTKNDTPSDFRLGIFGDLKVWDKRKKKENSEEFFWRLLKVARPPFSGDRWTHVIVSWQGLNTGQAGRGKLYLDGKFVGETGGIYEPFIWNLPEATIRLGTGPFVGMFDDLAVFNRYLTDDEVLSLYTLNGGIADLHR